MSEETENMQNDMVGNSESSQTNQDARHNQEKKSSQMSSAALMLLLFMLISQVATGIYTNTS